MNIIEAIKERRSVRSFNGESLSQAQRNELKNAINTVESPFGGNVTIRLQSFDMKEGFIPSTYGMIKGAVDFFLLGIKDDKQSALTADPWHLNEDMYPVSGGHSIGRPYIQSAMTLPIYDTAEKYSGPALVINGMADVVVPYTYAERYHKVLKNSILELIPGEDHTYNYSPEYVVGIVTDWLKNHLL